MLLSADFDVSDKNKGFYNPLQEKSCIFLEVLIPEEKLSKVSCRDSREGTTTIVYHSIPQSGLQNKSLTDFPSFILAFLWSFLQYACNPSDFFKQVSLYPISVQNTPIASIPFKMKSSFQTMANKSLLDGSLTSLRSSPASPLTLLCCNLLVFPLDT